MPNEQNTYRLAELIEEKYGKEKFETGIKIVAQWLSFETGSRHGPDWIEYLCRAKKAEKLNAIDRYEAKALCKLFGLKSFMALFTIPEQCNISDGNGDTAPKHQ